MGNKNKNIESVHTFIKREEDAVSQKEAETKATFSRPAACTLNNEEITKLPVNAGTDENFSSKETPIRANDHIDAKILSVAGADAKDECLTTPLHRAVFYGKLDTVNLLVNSGADVNVKDKEGDTALAYATKICSLDMVKLLIESGADVHRKNKRGLTALHHAAHNNSRSIIKHLLLCGADINAQDKLGRTALHIAAEENKVTSHIDTVEIHSNNGVDVHALNDEGEMPINSLMENRNDSSKVSELVVENMTKSNAECDLKGESLKDEKETGKLTKEKTETTVHDSLLNILKEIKTEMSDGWEAHEVSNERRWKILEQKIEDVNKENEDLKKTIDNLKVKVNELIIAMQMMMDYL